MKKLNTIKLLLLLGGIMLQSCGLEDSAVTEKETAYVPIYKPYAEFNQIEVVKDKVLEKSGKIFTLPGTLFISEPGKGIHIFDNSDAKNPKRLNFISIPGNIDMEFKKNILYADNGLDLVAIDISNINEPKVVERIEDIFPYPWYPPHENVKFVCPDSTKGYVVDWELQEVLNPKCKR